MHSAPAPTEPPSTQDEPRPVHSLLSIAIMVALSAVALFAVREAGREAVVRVHHWEFAGTDPAAGPWRFPEAGREGTADGIAYTATATGPGPMLTLDFNAEQVGRIRLRMSVSRVEDGRELPFVTEWYWASPEDVSNANGGWPFSAERGATFLEPDRHQPELRSLTLADDPRWKGPIARGFIAVKLPDEETGPFRIETKMIEFLE